MRWIAQNSVTTVSAEAACVAREQCWMTVAAVRCVLRDPEKPATVQSQAWMASSVARG